jgi:hypothetical protein
MALEVPTAPPQKRNARVGPPQAQDNKIITTEMILQDDGDITNQDGDKSTTYCGSKKRKSWIGTGADVNNSYLALRFHGQPLPVTAQILSATLQLTNNHPNNQKGATAFEVRTEKSHAPKPFLCTPETAPSLRTTTNSSGYYAGDDNWLTDAVWKIDVTNPLKELMAEGYASENIALIVKGTGKREARKFFYNPEKEGIDLQTLPKLIVTYRVAPVLSNAKALQNFLDSLAGVENVYIGKHGAISVTINGEPHRGQLDEQVIAGPPPVDGQLHLSHIGDVNSDGIEDYQFTYPSGDRQVAYYFGVKQDPDPNEHEGESMAQVSLVGVSETTFNPQVGTLFFKISGTTFSSDPADILVMINNQEVSANTIVLSADTIAVTYTFKEGVNNLLLSANDVDGGGLIKEANLWAGSYSMTVKVVDENLQPVTGAVVTAKLGDNQAVVSEAITINGQVKFDNLPVRTLLFAAVYDKWHFGTTAAVGNVGTVGLRFLGVEPSSSIDNNDFSLGSTEGWNVGNAPVRLIPHVEFSPTVFSSANVMNQKKMNVQPSLPSATNEGVNSDRRVLWKKFQEQHSELSNNSFITDMVNLETTTNQNLDLELSTYAEGGQSVSRTFTTKPATKNVIMRYQFITSEVPGGFYGSKYNDFFTVALRSPSAGLIMTSRTMNSFRISDFDANGATAWHQLSLPVKGGEDVQVSVLVANIGDGIYDSQVRIDLIEEREIVIPHVTLLDIDDSPLNFLSAAEHPYFGGNTRLHGTITIEGQKDDQIESLVLEIGIGDRWMWVSASANLSSEAQQVLLQQPFGDDEKLEITTPQLLFELPSTLAHQGIGSRASWDDDTVNFRVKAVSRQGHTATREVGSAGVLVRHLNNVHYGERDEERGGDDWVKPGVNYVINHYPVSVGDISNMNGGSFAPDHRLHDTGNDFDGWFNGYNARNAATAERIIEMLNDTTPVGPLEAEEAPPVGSRIQFVYVTFSRTPTDSFWNAIRNVTLNDGRQARRVIRSVSGHTSHFHVRIIDQPFQLPAWVWYP